MLACLSGIFKRKMLLFSSVFLFATSSCTKDKIGSCQDFADLPQNYNYGVASDRRYFYSVPHFNPNNPNEFVCIKGDTVNHIGVFLIFNLQTSVSRSVYSSDKIWSSPRWSKKDWIVFGQQGSLYKIKADGDSLTRLTFTGSNHYPLWNFDGTRIAYHTNEAVSALEIIDESGNLISRIEHTPHIGGDWSIPNHLIATSNSSQIGLINDTSYATRLIDLADNKAYYSICWLDNDNVLCVKENSIYKLNINSQSLTLVKAGCQTKTYESVSVSSDLQKIIVEATEYTVNKQSRSIDYHSELYLMNIDGTEERKIDLPKY